MTDNVGVMMWALLCTGILHTDKLYPLWLCGLWSVVGSTKINKSLRCQMALMLELMCIILLMLVIVQNVPYLLPPSNHRAVQLSRRILKCLTLLSCYFSLGVVPAKLGVYCFINDIFFTASVEGIKYSTKFKKIV